MDVCVKLFEMHINRRKREFALKHPEGIWFIYLNFTICLSISNTIESRYAIIFNNHQSISFILATASDEDDLAFLEEDDDDHESDESNQPEMVSPKEAGHNIYILAHQVIFFAIISFSLHLFLSFLFGSISKFHSKNTRKMLLSSFLATIKIWPIC